MAILGTHDSMSYLRPQWWAIPFAWMARTQSRTLEQQLEDGVRVFDLRIRWNEKKKTWHFAHGLCTYRFSEKGFDDILDYFDVIHTWALPEPVYCRICLEEMTDGNIAMEAGSQEISKFVDFCAYLNLSYPAINFYGGFIKTQWDAPVYQFKDINGVEIHNTHVSERFRSRWYSGHWSSCYPKLFAWLNNRMYKNSNGLKKYLMLDFYQIGI